MIPHPDKAATGGADAFFYLYAWLATHTHQHTHQHTHSHNRLALPLSLYLISPATGCIGVADGVGEWDSFGLNPRLFAEQLMRGCAKSSIDNAPDGQSVSQSVS